MGSPTKSARNAPDRLATARDRSTLETSERILRVAALLVIAISLGQGLLRLGEEPAGRDSWRQTDGLMVGRNFCVEDTPLWEPRIHARGEGSGITGMEFPILNYVAGSAACADGVGNQVAQVFVARSLVWLFTAVGIVALFILLRRMSDERVAIISTALFAASPLITYYGVSPQPDVPALSLALVAVVLHLESDRQPAFFWLSAGAWMLAILIKLPTIVFGLASLIIVWRRRGRGFLLVWQVWFYGLLALLPALLWYRHARRLQTLYGYQYFFLGKNFSLLVSDWLNPTFYSRLLGQLFDVTLFPAATAVTALTIVVSWRRIPVLMRALLLAIVAYWFLAGDHAAHHYYYGILAVPVFASLAGFGAIAFSENWPNNVRAGILLLLMAGASLHSLVRTAHWLPSEQRVDAIKEARRAVDAASSSNDRVVLFSNNDPTLLWFLDRRGWLLSNDAVVPLAARLVLIDRAQFDDTTRRAIANRIEGAAFVRRATTSRLDIYGAQER